jgi:parallel beta-helix repeat protein
MNIKKLILTIIIFTNIFLLAGCIDENNNNGKYDLYVGANLNDAFNNIQDAIDNASNGDSIFLYNGIYNEIISINKSVKIIGENNEKTILNYNGTIVNNLGVISIFADNCTIDNIKITNKNIIDSLNGIVIQSSNNTIINNSISKTGKGIFIDSNYNINSRNNSIINNNISDNHYGIYIQYSNNNNISNNIIYKNIDYGTYVLSSDDCIISYCNYFKNDIGIRLKSAKYNTITNNNISINNKGLYVCCGSYNNNIYHNNFINNTISSDDHYTTYYNTLESPFQGNYWSDLTPPINSTDEFSGKDYDIPGSDGIWDNVTYNVYNGNNKDFYPYVNPIKFN